MVEVCCEEIMSNKQTSTSGDSVSRAARRRRMEIRKDVADSGFKKPRVSVSVSPAASLYSHESMADEEVLKDTRTGFVSTSSGGVTTPKFGVASVCGRRREMEDAVSVHPCFLKTDDDEKSDIHYFGVFDGHGCSHVARRCKDRLHVLVEEEFKRGKESVDWKKTMERSFGEMDDEVANLGNIKTVTGECPCELRSPESYGVGSTAVVAVVTPDKIIVANCGDSRAVLCRNGKPVPLSNDHKPDRPDELNRIQATGGRVLYWNGARVCGVLATSRAIGDTYLKPYVSSEPEVTITDRTSEDDCVILASDGLWDVVSNETACGLASMCLRGNGQSANMKSPPANDAIEYKNCDRACLDASLLLTKLAMARRTMDNVSVVVIDLRKS